MQKCTQNGWMDAEEREGPEVAYLDVNDLPFGFPAPPR